MPDWLIDLLIGLGLSGIAFQWKKPLALRASLIAAFLALTALSWLRVAPARPVLIVLGVICFSVFLWKLGRQPGRANTFVLLVFAV